MNDIRNNKILPFDYVVVSAALTANAAGVSTLTLQADSWFELHGYFGSCTEDLDTDFMPNNFSVQISDQSTGRFLSSARVPQRAIGAPANGGLLLLVPVAFPPNATLTFDFLNLTANTNTVTLTLRGIKNFGLVGN